ncbi:hypothetical protein POM88_033239 [Heracleum sosnowskyi]|uniref:Uncharacterized protein n=1 Tax=Heracleum sosnowskyi TaxID=360622 RepID=A0AAD8I165_9APIA|nr:hypothetical protein POM88_033239 [Heracleum sosnowskyi]
MGEMGWEESSGGKIEAEVKLTGILSLGALQPGESRKYGTTIAPGLCLRSLVEAGNVAIFVVIAGLLAKEFASLSSIIATRTYSNIDYAPLDTLKQQTSVSSGKAVGSTPHPVLIQRERFATTTSVDEV